MDMRIITSILLVSTILLSACTPAATPATPTEPPVPSISAPTSVPENTPETIGPGAGFRFSTYGIGTNPGPGYWVSVGQQMSSKFAGSHPEALWIAGNFMGEGMTYLSFHAETDDPHITSGYVDMNTQVLDLFDKHGFKVWLQVEPGDADMITLIDLVLNQYKHHPSVIGFGVDVEWYKSDGSPMGTPITDEEAQAWVQAVRKHNPKYRLFLKHWETRFMPPLYRDGITFIDDSQEFESFDAMLNEFRAWGKYFSPSPVGFQFGYPADRKWWSTMQDPAGEIGNALLADIPNTTSVFWVDFTVKEVFSP